MTVIAHEGNDGLLTMRGRDDRHCLLHCIHARTNEVTLTRAAAYFDNATGLIVNGPGSLPLFSPMM
jgi:hypothetical protein